ncbi:MAG: hypothetical protein Q4A07_13875 [Coriobacteriales bacterium]|nr:hypothetical protein [Coriobacteriales bacterium]
MGVIDDSARATCDFQGRVFEASAERLGHCGSAVFVRRFMRSAVARRIDLSGAVWDGADPQNVVMEVDAEYNGRPYGKEVYPQEVLYWMGYVYRCGTYVTNYSSSALYAVVGAREMRELYYAYHTLDPAQCVERILESRHIKLEEDTLQRGVEALRRIRSNWPKGA